jgi:DNA-binding HxlR family transcriptional regulator
MLGIVVGKRSYDDPCGVARALNLVGERWALLVVRELLLGPKRFTDLSRGLPGVSQNVLSQRLRELEQAGIVRRRRLGPPASLSAYELTGRGHDLEPVLLGLARWGSRTPTTSTGELSVDALALALRTTFDPGAAGGLNARFDVRLGDDRLHAEIGDGLFHLARGTAEVAHGSADLPDAVIETDVATLRALVFGRRRLADTLRTGDLQVQGDRRAVARFVESFPLPTPAPTTGG